MVHPDEGQLTFTPIGQYIPDYLRKYVSPDCLNTVVVKDIVIQDQIHDMYSDIEVTSVIPPVWTDPIDVQLSDLGEQLKCSVPIPVFNALIDVFDMRQMTLDGE